jgi:hypothetical protein
MIRKTRRALQKRNYPAPDAKITPLALESSICQSARFLFQVDEIEHLYHHEDGTEDVEQMYFEF